MKYDFAVVGAGPGGYTFAIRASQFKKKCIIFDESNVGGTCLNVGCIPSKTWINVSTIYDAIKNESAQLGIDVRGVQLNWSKIQEFRNNVVSKLQNGIKALFKSYAIDYKNSPVTKIDGSKIYYIYNDSTKFIEADKIVIAIGGAPIELKEFDYKNSNILTYKNCFQLNELPKSLVVIGGGIIGIELGQTFANFGVKVYVIELLDNILTGVDIDAANFVIRKLKKHNVEIFTGSKVDMVKYNNNSVDITVRNLKTNQLTNIAAEKVIVSVGIKPKDVKELGNFALSGKGWVKVDENFRTSVKNVYAIGDITGPPFLAHRSSFQGKMLTESLVKGIPVYTPDLIPSVIYTTPEIASVGLQEQDLKNKKIEYAVSKFYYLALGRAVADNKTDGFVKVITTPDKKEILGVTICGKNASDLISQYTLAMESKLSLEDISLIIYPHPTYSELIMESAENVAGYAIHSVPR